MIHMRHKINKITGLVLVFCMTMICSAGVWIQNSTVAAYAQEKNTDYKSNYAQVIYDKDHGLETLEINDIAQTADGYLWAGSYSGLLKYDGGQFLPADLAEPIYTVRVLFVDSTGKLWIGTNDAGIYGLDIETGDMEHYSTKDGLASDVIRSIAEDEQHNIYVGTQTSVCVLPFDRGDGAALRVLDQESDLNCIVDMHFDTYRKLVVCVSSVGNVITISDGRITGRTSCEKGNGVYYMSACAAPQGYLLGTSDGTVDFCLVDEHAEGIADHPKVLRSQQMINMGMINRIVAEVNGDGQFICGSAGFGYLSENGEFMQLSNEAFSNSICDCICDMQGNYWFNSDKVGIVRLSMNPFGDCFQRVGLNERVVNAVLKKDSLLYIGCDDGLVIIDEANSCVLDNAALEGLKTARIRNINEDSKGNIWFSSYGPDGLVCYHEDGKVTSFNAETAGTLGSRFRSSIELSDGTIVAASAEGLNYIKDEKVIHTLGEADGMTTPVVLSLVEAADGDLLAGSDGGGVYRIREGRLIETIGPKENMQSLVILRIVPCTDGYIFVTSNSLYYANEKTGEVNLLDQFPYSNNYDVLFTEDGEAWVSSSKGIFVVKETELLSNTKMNTVLLDRYRGLNTSLTANAWNAIDEDDNYYICCGTGVKKINIRNYDQLNDDYEINLYQVVLDGEVQLDMENGRYEIPAGNNRVEFKPAILNYTLSNLLVHVYIEGVQDVGVTMLQNEVTPISYTNLPHGSYQLHIQIIDPVTEKALREKVYPVEKEALFYETIWFQIWLVLCGCIIVIALTWFVFHLHHLSVMKRQYEQIREAKEEAERANSAKSRFLANMSHEIRTPINTIIGMDEMILREEIPDEVRQHAYDIKEASASLLTLINDILDFSKIESGKMDIIPQEYHPAKLLRDLGGMLQVQAESKGLQIHIDIDKDIPSVLYGDEQRMKQIILNLISNAVKYTREGSVTLRVALQKQQDGVKNNKEVLLRVSVADTGIGIRQEDIGKLFQVFERLDGKKNANIQGTGLGLNITQNLLHSMGSELIVESEYEKGSEFWFVISQGLVDAAPIGDIFANNQLQTDDKKAYQLQIEAPEARLLVVDDNRMNLVVAKGLMKPTKVQITTAMSGAACLEKISQEKYDLVLLDYMMPEMDGRETLEQIRNTHPEYADVPVIVLTANAVAGMREQYIEEGFSDYLSKPIVLPELERVLVEYLPENKIIKKETEK